MIPHSSAFAAAVVQTHDVEIRIEVLDPEGSGAVLCSLRPDGGGLVRERSRTTCEFTIAGTLRDMVPPSVDPAVLLPFGTEVRIWRGIPGIEMIPQGIFRLIGANLTASVDSGIAGRFRGVDRSERFGRKLITAHDTPLDANYGTDIKALLTKAWVGLGDGSGVPPFRMVATDHRAPPLHLDAQTEAWPEAQRRAAACDRELFVDYEGAVCFQPFPTVDDPPVWQFVDGVNDTRIELSPSYSSESLHNYWVVNATHSSVSDKDISGTVWVDDPTSRLFVGGAFGTSPDEIDSVYATSEEQCKAEGRALRSKTLRGTDTLAVEAVPNEALLAGDVVLVTCEELEIFDQVRIISSIDAMPLDGDTPMRLTLGRG